MVALICLPFLLLSCQKDNTEKPVSKINYHFATLAEGQQLLAANDEYYNSLNQNNIDWRMRRTGATLEELKSFVQTCVRDFNEHIDNYAEFTINGEKRNCELTVFYTKTWGEAYAEVGDEASFFSYNQAVLVPIDALDTYYPVEEASDFWDVVGRNTDYVIAPEECLADNFSYTIVYGFDGKDYQTLQLITDIYNLLCNYNLEN